MNDLNLEQGKLDARQSQHGFRVAVRAGTTIGSRWGAGGHDLTHGGAIFPDTMRWIWRGLSGRERRGTLQRT